MYGEEEYTYQDYEDYEENDFDYQENNFDYQENSFDYQDQYYNYHYNLNLYIWAQAIYDYEAQTEQDISFKRGDIIGIIEEREDGWSVGENQHYPGFQGLFPSQYVQKLEIYCLNDSKTKDEQKMFQNQKENRSHVEAQKQILKEKYSQKLKERQNMEKESQLPQQNDAIQTASKLLNELSLHVTNNITTEFAELEEKCSSYQKEADDWKKKHIETHKRCMEVEQQYEDAQAKHKEEMDNWEQKYSNLEEKYKDLEKIYEEIARKHKYHMGQNLSVLSFEELHELETHIVMETLPQMKKAMNQKKEENLCSICLFQTKSHALVPCGHLICGNCGDKLEKKACPFCKQNIQSVMKLYQCQY